MPASICGHGGQRCTGQRWGGAVGHSVVAAAVAAAVAVEVIAIVVAVLSSVPPGTVLHSHHRSPSFPPPGH